MQHTLVALVEDKPGVLNRVSSLFRRRAFNIESLTVGHTETAGISRMTIVVDTDERGAQLVDVYRARIVDVGPESLVIEATGTEDKIDSLLEVLRPYGIGEMVRTGRVAMARGTGTADKMAPRGQTAAAPAGD